MKHKYNTSSCLSVFPPDPVSDTVANTAKNAQKNVGIKIQENKKIRQKKLNFPRLGSAVPRRSILEWDTWNAHKTRKDGPKIPTGRNFFFRIFQNKMFSHGIIHSITPNLNSCCARQSDQNNVYLPRKKNVSNLFSNGQKGEKPLRKKLSAGINL